MCLIQPCLPLQLKQALQDKHRKELSNWGVLENGSCSEVLQEGAGTEEKLEPVVAKKVSKQSRSARKWEIATRNEEER